MNIDVYTSTGTKKGTIALPASVFESAINDGLMHQAVIRQQSNRRYSIAHAKSRGEIRGSTKKLYAQKGTGRARRGSVRSPLLRGGGKAFGPRNNTNFTKDMPHKMRQAALRSCLSAQAVAGKIIGLEGYKEERSTKKASALLTKLPVELGRSILFVLPESNNDLQLSVRNIPGVKTVQVGYLNPVDILNSRSIIFMTDAIKKVEEIFGAKKDSIKSEIRSSK
ncbi:MAG: 50S ribosomal protein L4, partial [Candidatus Peribacteraceae bacterium]|nr:50S ribosomal protein L4 [Candidatus Peribacteraceae bacterium]